MGIFKNMSKLNKDYNELLEQVLDKKTFSSNIKNILLSMIYKLENAYPDYARVKRHVRSKDEFLLELIDTVKKYCEYIKTVEPDSQEAESLKNHNVLALTNDRERSVLAYPTEISLLYALSDIVPKYFVMENRFIFRSLLQTALVEGYNYNNVSMLQDFNGWSWDNTAKKNTPFISNLIYQNLLCLFGEDYLAYWRNTNSIKVRNIDVLKKKIQELDSNNNYLYETLNLLYKAASEKDRKLLQPDLEKYYKEYLVMQNVEEFQKSIEARKHILSTRMKQIDDISTNPVLLTKDLERRNKGVSPDRKIANINLLLNMLKNEKQELEVKYNELKRLQSPVMYINLRSEYAAYAYIYTNTDSLETAVIKSQIEYLKLYDKKIANDENRDQILDIIYELRYYEKINLNNRRKIESIDKLKTQVDVILKKALTKACNYGIIRILSLNIAMNFDIINLILESNMLDLEDARVELEVLSEDEINVKIYDKDVFEREEVIKFKGTVKDLQVKQRKQIKVFIKA